MNQQSFRCLAAVAVLAILAPCAAAQAHPPAPQATSPSTVTRNLQGNDEDAWIADPHIHAFYDTVVAAAATHGAASIDVPALELKSRAIFRAFAVSKGLNPDAMEKHLALIPRQMAEIAKEDPKVLDSYDNFVLALFGPK